jgi:hypothetical protein
LFAPQVGAVMIKLAPFMIYMPYFYHNFRRDMNDFVRCGPKNKDWEKGQETNAIPL